jgi:flagellar hook-associated protein 3 FlgL
MNLHVTLQTMVGSALTNMQDQTAQIANLQEQAATGLKVSQASDNPSAMQMILAGQNEQSQLDAYLNNITSAQSSLNGSVSALQQADNLLSQAKSIALQGANSTNDASSLGALADQVDQLISQMLSVANSQQNGEYIYAGTASKTTPFVVTATNNQGQPAAIAYQGSEQGMQVGVGANQSVTSYTPGDQIFSDALNGLLALRDQLRNTAGLPQTQQIQNLSQLAGTLDAANQNVLQTTGQQSAQLQTLSSLQTQTQNVKLSSQQFVSGLQDADLSQVAVQLQAQENQLQLTLATTARMFDQSLLQFIQ